MFGQPEREHWRAPARTTDYWGVKGIAEALAPRRACGSTPRRPRPPTATRRGRRSFRPAGAKVGWVGEIHPLVLREFDVRGPVAALGLDLASLLDAAPTERPVFEDLLTVPVSRRDLALLVPDTVAAAERDRPRPGPPVAPSCTMCGSSTGTPATRSRRARSASRCGSRSPTRAAR